MEVKFSQAAVEGTTAELSDLKDSKLMNLSEFKLCCSGVQSFTDLVVIEPQLPQKVKS